MEGGGTHSCSLRWNSDHTGALGNSCLLAGQIPNSAPYEEEERKELFTHPHAFTVAAR